MNYKEDSLENLVRILNHVTHKIRKRTGMYVDNRGEYYKLSRVWYIDYEGDVVTRSNYEGNI